MEEAPMEAMMAKFAWFPNSVLLPLVIAVLAIPASLPAAEEPRVAAAAAG